MSLNPRGSQYVHYVYSKSSYFLRPVPAGEGTGPYSWPAGSMAGSGLWTEWPGGNRGGETFNIHQLTCRASTEPAADQPCGSLEAPLIQVNGTLVCAPRPPYPQSWRQRLPRKWAWSRARWCSASSATTRRGWGRTEGPEWNVRMCIAGAAGGASEESRYLHHSDR